MIVTDISLDSKDQVVVRIVREILNLFKISEAQEGERPEHNLLAITNVETSAPSGLPKVHSTVLIRHLDGTEEHYCYDDSIKPDEKEAAGIHRIIKRNLYHIFCHDFKMPPAPWGILHGVRPTKIVHRFIDMGLNQAEIEARLKDDYAASDERAKRLTDIAFLQRPFLASSDERTISVYVGIPFCLSRCLYCSFAANVLPSRQKLLEFMAVWKKDLQAVCREIAEYHFKVQSIYVGGGTPTSLPDDLFSEMLHLVRSSFWDENTLEFTVEAGRPDSMSAAKIACMKECGATRVSVNPQTMQQRTLHRIGRNHTPEDIVTMFQSLREAGIPHINMDLILGLPGETDADVEDTMQKIEVLHPDDVTLHALALKRGSRLKMNLQDFELPDDAMTQKMFAIAMRHVQEMGLHPYYLYRQGYMSGQLENVGCSIDGAEGMYNIQIMEEHQTVLGIGAAATSKIVDFRGKRLKSSFNAKDLTTYLRDIDKYIEKRHLLLQEAYGD